jgi:flagellar motor switch protein FliN/FliY
MAETQTAKPDAPNVTAILEEFADFLDVPLRITLEVGRRSMKVREILQLKPKSIVVVPKSAGENIDIYVNEKLVAFGEILEMEGRAGIRLTDFYVHN